MSYNDPTMPLPDFETIASLYPVLGAVVVLLGAGGWSLVWYQRQQDAIAAARDKRVQAMINEAADRELKAYRQGWNDRGEFEDELDCGYFKRTRP